MLCDGSHSDSLGEHIFHQLHHQDTTAVVQYLRIHVFYSLIIHNVHQMDKKLKKFQRGIGIAEKNSWDRWGGKPQIPILTLNLHKIFASWCSSICSGVKMGICGLHYHPSNPFLFCEFFPQSLLPC